MPRPVGAWLAAGVLAAASATALAAGAPIYKCFDSHLNIVYTDLPCRDGEKLDIRAGDADPAAVARLDHALDQLDQMAMQRVLDERHAAAARSYATGLLPEPSVPPLADAFDSDYGYGYGYGGGWYPPYRRRHLQHPHPHPHPFGPPEPPGFMHGPRS